MALANRELLEGTLSTIARALTSLPYAQYRKDPRYYIHYDSLFLVGEVALLALIFATGYQSPITEWKPQYWLFFPLVLYVQILCSVFIHNAVHGNFPKWINRIVGEICGIVVLTRFASWEIVHRRHHRYSDDRDKDPHPALASYWAYVFFTVKNVEHQLQEQYFELYGDTPENRIYERQRAWMSYVTNLLLIACWFFVLGPVLFFGFFVPATLIGILHLVHFNWVGHNALAKTGEFFPSDVNTGIYKLGNKIFFGIYMHATHHRLTMLFNPAKVPARLKRSNESAAIESVHSEPPTQNA